MLVRLLSNLLSVYTKKKENKREAKETFSLNFYLSSHEISSSNLSIARNNILDL